MNNFEYAIGKNIKEIRLEKGLSQEALSKQCSFSNTTLSAYENGRKIPNITTIARIAKNLNVSIERLYYGDENSAFITSETDEGKQIVNSIYLLWSLGIIEYYENPFSDIYWSDYVASGNPKGIFLYLNKYDEPIMRFINSLNEFKKKIHTYSDPDKYLEILKMSIATEINDQIKHI